MKFFPKNPKKEKKKKKINTKQSEDEEIGDTNRVCTEKVDRIC